MTSFIISVTAHLWDNCYATSKFVPAISWV